MNKKMKIFGGRVQFKADGQPGEFRAVFATFNVVDHDNDITLPGAFKEGQAVRISSWNHGWENLPVGRGEIHSDEHEAWVEGQFFLNTEAGKEHYETIKALDELGEWSYGFRIEKWSYQQEDASGGMKMPVRILEKLDVIEVSPVMQGAGIGTRTADIKVGRRNSAKDLEDIQAVHDAAARLGAKCGDNEGDNADGDEGDGKTETEPDRKAGQLPSVFMKRIEILGIAYEQ